MTTATRVQPRISQSSAPHDELPEPELEAPAVRIDTATAKATFADLMAKPRRVMSIPVTVPDGQGGSTELNVKFQAIAGTAYDELLAAHPPTKTEKAEGNVFHQDTFAPALIAATAVEPAMTYEQAQALWTNEEWSPGELGQLFMAAITVCQAGLNVPFNAAG